jgi:integrase
VAADQANLRPGTLVLCDDLLRRILNVAVEAGYLPRNPCTVKGAGTERAAEMRHASIPQLHHLADAVPGRYRALILLAGYGGLRWAELVGLRQCDVDVAGARVQVVEQVGGLDGLRVHDLRHTAATPAAAAGATTKELMERMGHTSPAVALGYQHVMADRQARLASALDDVARLAATPARGAARARKGTQRARRR